MRLSLRNRFLVPTLALIILGMGISGLTSYLKSKNALEQTIIQQVKQIADSTHKVIKSWKNDRKLDIISWSRLKLYQTALQDSFMGKAARKTANEQLAYLKQDYKYYENIILANRDGDLIAAADQSVIDKGINIGDRDYFKSAMQGNTSVSEVIKSRGTGSPIFVVASPVKGEGNVEGVLFGVVDITHFNKVFIDSIRVGESGYAFLMNDKGVVIAHPDKKNILTLDINQFDFGRQIMQIQGQGFIQYTWKDQEKMVAVRTFEEMGWRLAVGAVNAELLAPIRNLGIINLTVTVAVVLLGALITLLVVQSTVKPINRIVNSLNEGSNEVSTGSAQVASSSQQLAEGASQQAASLEETSSSLEEMSSMTRQNADNANQAKTMMSEAGQLVESVHRQMTEMVDAINEITRTSEETGKIIKTIDEIAFQTNLLALNAAVEAARAGEAGAGFAVVADEVRNLAMRAADAARNTSSLIENTIKAVHKGSDLTISTQEAFKENMEISVKVGDLVQEIAAASNEQAQGISQVNTAVNEMDRVVQQVAANAEESASASEEMSAQAEQMKAMVNNLVELISGKRKGQAIQTETRQTVSRHQKPTVPAVTAPSMVKSTANRQLSAKHAEVKPDDIIPLDENESFKDF